MTEAPDTHTFEELYLYAFATQAEILHHLRTDALPAERENLDAVMRRWQQVQIRVTELIEREGGEAEKCLVEPLPAEHQSWVQQLTGETLFQKTFQHVPVSFSLVEVDRLIAPQRTVNLSYIKQLETQLSSVPDLTQLLELCLSSQKPYDPLQYVESHAHTHVFSSPHADMRFLGSYLKEISPDDYQYAETGGVPMAALIAFVGYGYAPVNVFQVDRRIILNNGFHRVYWLRRIGVRRIPVVIQHIWNSELEFPRSVLGLPRTYLLNHPRPVLMKDFFAPGFAMKLQVQRRLRMVKINVNASSYDVPY